MTLRSSPAPTTSVGVSRSGRAIDRHACQHLAASGACLMGLLAEQVLDPQHIRQGQVSVVAKQSLGQRLPADEALAVDVGDLAQLMLARRLAQLERQLGAEEDESRHRHPFGGLQGEQAAHAMSDDDRSRAEPVERGDDVLGVGVE